MRDAFVADAAELAALFAQFAQQDRVRLRLDVVTNNSCRRWHRDDAKEMLAYQHSGFSVDAGVCIEAHDRAALERQLRYCARPPFAMERLRKEGAGLVYRCAKQRSEPTSDKRGAKVDELHLTACCIAINHG